MIPIIELITEAKFRDSTMLQDLKIENSMVWSPGLWPALPKKPPALPLKKQLPSVKELGGGLAAPYPELQCSGTRAANPELLCSGTIDAARAPPWAFRIGAAAPFRDCDAAGLRIRAASNFSTSCAAAAAAASFRACRDMVARSK